MSKLSEAQLSVFYSSTAPGIIIIKSVIHIYTCTSNPFIPGVAIQRAGMVQITSGHLCSMESRQANATDYQQ